MTSPGAPDGRDCARYPIREDAEAAAQAACDQARACGRAVRLTTRQPDGELRTVVVF